MLNEKDREEIRQTIAGALAQSITGRVEHIITDALSAKVGNIQKAQAEAEAATEAARKEMASYQERSIIAERQLNELRAQIVAEGKAFKDAMADLQTQEKTMKAKLADLQKSVSLEEKNAEEKIKASRKHTEEAILVHQAAIDQIERERARLEKGHEEYKRSVGLG